MSRNLSALCFMHHLGVTHRRCAVAASLKGQNQMFALEPLRFSQGLEEQRSLPKRSS